MGFFNGLDGHVANALRQNKVDALILDFFILPHRTKKRRCRNHGQPVREAGLVHKTADAPSDMHFRQAKMRGQSCGNDHAYGNGLPMLVTPILRDRFQGMAQRMSEIQDAPPVTFSFIFGHNRRLNG